eukprot:scaffold656_cov403-Pavlova_lutheri.AAC.55
MARGKNDHAFQRRARYPIANECILVHYISLSNDRVMRKIGTIHGVALASTFLDRPNRPTAISASHVLFPPSI